MDDKSPHGFSVLSSFTGYLVRFAAPQPDEFVDSAALVSGSSPAIILLFRKYIDDDDVRLRESPRRVYMAEPDSESYDVSEDRYACPLIRLAVRGIHTIGELGSVAPFPLAVAKRIFNPMRFFNAEPIESDDEDTMMFEEESIWKFWIGYDNRCYLMESKIFFLEKEDAPRPLHLGDAYGHFINYSHKILQSHTTARLKPPSKQQLSLHLYN
ncbi:unnamed protein product [Triticum turgidum subsp. durum]|uniref:Uncharacterized protein n=1 Tax=Triticum turgidum subsp. durum TaxID=4567 RepID=A0A9R1RX53_TRITD|nr:unnamed protein product [Triticum turgidum subsp. durum]